MNDPKSLAAVLLLAGPSTRLGYPKQLVRYRGEVLARRTARLLAGLECVRDDVIAVTGFEADSVSAELAGLPVRPVLNRAWEEGMGGSIACGVRAVSGQVDGILVSVCDQWQLEAADVQKLVDAWSAAPERIHVACWNEGAAQVSGPPVIFPIDLRGELKGLKKSRGARQIIDRYMNRVEFVDVPGAGTDLDRPEDLEILLNS